MEPPNLDRMWETYIKLLYPPTRKNIEKVFDDIRFKIHPLVLKLKETGIINWFFFLIHPCDDESCFHIRFGLSEGVDPKDFRASLPKYCIKTNKIERRNVENIKGIDKTILKNEEIEEAWRVMGEQSQWIIDVLTIHKEDVEITSQQVAQFLHYYRNVTQLWPVCPKCGRIVFC